MTVHEYITKNWKNVIRIPGESDKLSFIKMPSPYTTPCIDELFVNFFYWDTYFTDLGLIRDGIADQVKNDLDVMAFFIEKLGFVPNADHILTRTQPPLFTRDVYNFYKFTGDKKAALKYLPMIFRELSFFELDRMTPVGLNAYGNNETNLGKKWYYEEFFRRIGYTDEEKKLGKNKLIDGLLAIAESGWDFTPRFSSDGNRFDSTSFVHLDLNCILYDAEVKTAEMCGELKMADKAQTYREKAEKRKKLINSILLSPDGIYRDYDFVHKKFSSVVSAASLYPYALGVSTDAKSAENVYEKLNLKHGLSACEYRGENIAYLQWDYPSMWPTNVYFAYLAMKNVGLKAEAEEVSAKYMSTVEKVFDKTGKLWEKYDAEKCAVSVTTEYDTPSMMGWTAGVYDFLLDEKGLL